MTNSLVLNRFCEYQDTTPGELYFQDKFVCYTIERLWKANATNVSCIPVGTFRLLMTQSRRFGIVLPLIEVPGRTGIRLHAANRARELQGCIAPVSKIQLSPTGVFGSNSRAALDEVLDLIKKNNINELIVTTSN